MAHDHKVLDALDAAKTQWYHFTAVVIAGMGFFTDAYDLFSISLVTKLLGRIYYFDPSSRTPGSLPPNVSAAVNGVAFCGTLAGQLFFGWLGDKMGRKKVYGMTLMLMVVCCLASGLSFGSTPRSVMATLCFFRFWLGFGIGGDYPLSATIMSEYANKRTRGAFIAAVFAMPGFGNLTGGIVAIVVSAAFKSRFHAGVQGRPRRLHGAAGRLRVAHSPHVRRRPGAAHLLLADEDAGDGAVHRPGRQERQAGHVRHGARAQSRARRRRGGAEGEGGRGGAGAGAPPPRGVRALLPAVRQAARAPPGGHDGVLVRAGHRLLLAEPVPEGHLRRRELAAQGVHHERAGGDVQHLPRADARRAVRHHPGLLVHHLLHRRRRPFPHPARRLLHEGLHAGPRHPVAPLDHAGAPRRLRRHVHLHLLLRQLWSKLHHLRRAGGDLPGEAAVHLPRHLLSCGEVWRHCRVVWVPVRSAEHGSHQDRHRVPAGHRTPQLPVHARRMQCHRLPVHVPGAGVQGQVAGGALRRGGGRGGSTWPE